MCLVLDINSLHSFFDSSDTDYEPVRNWVFRQEGKLVYGGSAYKGELKKASKYIRLLGQLYRSGKIVNIDDAKVDQREEELKGLISHRDFDDPHIIAILNVSGCKVVCTKDDRAIPFIKDRNLYNNNVSPPKVYKTFSNASLLCRNNLAAVCTPCKRLNKEQLRVLSGAVFS